MKDGKVTRQTSMGQQGVETDAETEYQYEIKVFKSSAEAIQVLNELKPDLKVTNISSAKNGINLTSYLSAQELGPKLFKQAQKIGLYEFFSKKTSIKDLYQSSAAKQTENHSEIGGDHANS